MERAPCTGIQDEQGDPALEQCHTQADPPIREARAQLVAWECYKWYNNARTKDHRRGKTYIGFSSRVYVTVDWKSTPQNHNLANLLWKCWVCLYSLQHPLSCYRAAIRPFLHSFCASFPFFTISFHSISLLNIRYFLYLSILTYLSM